MMGKTLVVLGAAIFVLVAEPLAISMALGFGTFHAVISMMGLSNPGLSI